MQAKAPSNFNKGRLIGGKYRSIDLAILLGGTGFSLIAIVGLIQLNVTNIYLILFLLLPAGISFALTLPFGVYHNLMMYMVMLYRFHTSKRTYMSEGIYLDEPE